MIASWIVNAITPELAGDTIYAETRRDLWVDLEERFSQINVPRIFELQHKIVSISQGPDSITVYYSKLKGLWDELNVYLLYLLAIVILTRSLRHIEIEIVLCSSLWD